MPLIRVNIFFVFFFGQAIERIYDGAAAPWRPTITRPPRLRNLRRQFSSVAFRTETYNERRRFLRRAGRPVEAMQWRAGRSVVGFYDAVALSWYVGACFFCFFYLHPAASHKFLHTYGHKLA